MCRFIKLTKLLINTRHIVHIEKNKEIYKLHLHNHRMDGFFFFGCGGLDSENNIIKVCKKEHPKDYDIMEKWVLDEKIRN
jgi:hypothetical protein